MVEREARGRRHRRGAAARVGLAPGAPARTRLTNPFRPVEILAPEQIETIHEASLRILREIGLRVLDDEGRALFAAAGAEVDEASQMVRLDGEMVLGAVAQAPTRLTLRARNPARDVAVGAGGVAFATVGGAPYVSDLEHGRRPGSLAAFEDLMRLAQSFDVIHLLAPATEPVELPVEERHLAFTRSQLLLTDKVPFVYSRGRRAVAESLDMIRLVHGLDEDAFAREPHCYTVVNSNSPLQLDSPMTQGIIDFARRGQLMVLTPFTLAGAMAPVSLAGALAQQNAEALAGIALAQIVRPGAPVVYGGFTSNVDMKSGAPAFGTPEYVKAAFASGQLARRYGLPWRSSNVNACNAPDAQAAYESQMSLWGALMGGCNVLMHGAGWLEGGLTASFEKFMLDIEMLQMFAEMFRPIECDADSLGLDAIREVGPGGHFFGAAHTLARYETAFYAPLISDWRNFEAWREAGALDAARRAHAAYKRTLAAYEAPPIDAGAQAALDDYVARARGAAAGPKLTGPEPTAPSRPCAAQ
jgi:trimethylamine--corrinoid protein Co-methyltransferase